MKIYAGKTLGFTKDAIFLSSKTNLNEAAVLEMDMPSKNIIGSDGAKIKKDKIEEIVFNDAKKYPLLISGKGALGDLISLNTGSKSAQKEIVDQVSQFIQRKAIYSEKEVSKLRRFLPTFIAGALIMALFTMIFFVPDNQSVDYSQMTDQQIAEMSDGAKAGQKRLLGKFLQSTGNLGILLIGGGFFLFFTWLAISKAKGNRITTTVTFE